MKINIVGVSEDGKKVVAGVFRLFDTVGLPLEIIFERIKNEDWIVDWKEFIGDARKHGWSDRTIRTRVITAYGDVFGMKKMDQFEKLFELNML